jgi:hypothetical protein
MEGRLGELARDLLLSTLDTHSAISRHRFCAAFLAMADRSEALRDLARAARLCFSARFRLSRCELI